MKLEQVLAQEIMRGTRRKFSRLHSDYLQEEIDAAERTTLKTQQPHQPQKKK